MMIEIVLAPSPGVGIALEASNARRFLTVRPPFRNVPRKKKV
jgi:hypothetical protein